MTPDPIIWILDHWPAIMEARDTLGPVIVAAPFLLLEAAILLWLVAPLVGDE